MPELSKILLKHWGFRSFRPMQEEIIRSVLEGRDTLALLPTGGGKSVCFQVPVLANEGIGIVVTPLIALMKDQVENLKRRDIPAAAIYSGMNHHAVEVVINNCIHGQLKFLYLSPERLETDMIRETIHRMKVNLIAVDEAHCISQWGYDFRPPYLKIAEFRKYIPGTPVLALTATATPEVIEDIQDKLEFGKKNVFRQSFERKNLTYVVLKEEDKLRRLLRVAANVGGSGIVYMRSRKKTVGIADFLKKNNFKADFYHAGLETRVRAQKQDAWMKGQNRVIVATNAFGMGIDKPNVRFVVHLDLPDNLEAYFQEAGRGGRDGKRSYAVLMYDPSDLAEIRKFIEKQYPQVEFIRKVYHTLGNYFNLAIGSGRDTSFEFDLYDFVAYYNLPVREAAFALRFLEKEGYIMLQDVIEGDSKVFIKASKEDLYRFQVENAKYDHFIKTLLRSYSGLFTEFVKINEKELATRLGLKEEEVEKTMEVLEKYNLLLYDKKKNKPLVTFLTERIDGKDIYISDEHYHTRKQKARERLDAVLNYLGNDTKCRSQQLLAYFGEEQPKRCGKCDVCVERNKIELSELEFDTILEKIKPLLRQKPYSIKDLAGHMTGINEERLIKVVQWLLDNGKVMYDEGRRLRWKD